MYDNHILIHIFTFSMNADPIANSLVPILMIN
jgi:hypothetical protein